MEGLEKFRGAFEAYSENYVIIGGTACDIAMTGTAVRPRATHDIDMIVIVEKMTADFAEHFWQFVREGGYRPEKRKQSEGEAPKYELYRFVNGKPDYPEMIELLSRHPDILGEPKGLTIEPLPVDEETSSLSAIIMDDDFVPESGLLHYETVQTLSDVFLVIVCQTYYADKRCPVVHGSMVRLNPCHGNSLSHTPTAGRKAGPPSAP